MPEKKKRKKWPFVVLAVVAAIILVPLIMTQVAINKLQNTKVYDQYTVATDTLTKTVTGSGTVASQDSQMQEALTGLKVDVVQASAGDSVSAGDTLATLDADSIEKLISTTTQTLSTLDSELKSLRSSASSNINAPYEARVKELFVSDGDDVNGIIAEKGALLVLSTDGKMAVTLQSSKELAIGAEVTVRLSDSSEKDGTVESKAADGYLVTFSDNGPKVGEEVQVYSSDDLLLGKGTARINAPVSILHNGGIVDDVSVSENDKVYSGTRLLSLTKSANPASYMQTYLERNQTAQDLQTLYGLQANPVLSAEYDGILTEITLQDGQEITSQSGATTATVATVDTGGVTKLVVDIDELDIASVQKGQSATVYIEALGQPELDATVDSISHVGTVGNGITNYPVTLKLTADERAFPDMNATATIQIETLTDALIVPLDYVQEDSTGSYVLLQSGADSQRVAVETGVSDGINVQILSGVNAGDIILKESSNSATAMMGMMSPMTMGGAGSNRQPPSGGGNSGSAPAPPSEG